MKNIDHKSRIKKFLIPKLRRLSRMWPPKEEAKRAARIERGLYKCAMCGKGHNYKNIQMDHIRPVIQVDKTTKEVDWNEYISRLFCDVSNYQALCCMCHDSKCLIEKNQRDINKAKRKKNG